MINGSLPLFGPMPMILDEAVREVYYEFGWSEYDIVEDGSKRLFPQLNDFIKKIDQIIENKGYSGEVLDTLKAATHVRIGSLNRGSKGRMLNALESIPIDYLLKFPVIFELDRLNSDEQAFFVLMMLSLMKTHIRIKRKSGSELKHCILIEEAHNLVPRGQNLSSSDESAKSKKSAVEFFTKMLAEMRALGEGFIICDQLPSAVSPEIIKNTNLKIMHRLTAHDDREELGKTMVIDKQQFVRAATLLPGEAFVYAEGWYRARQVLETDFKTLWDVGEPQDDQDIKDAMAYFISKRAKSFMPFSECTRLCRSCSLDVRNKAESFLNSIAQGRKRESLKDVMLNDAAIPDKEIKACRRFLKEAEKISNGDPTFLFCSYLNLVKTRPDLLAECRDNHLCDCFELENNSYLNKIISDSKDS